MDNEFDKPPSPKRPRRLVDGRRVLVKRPDAAKNARPKKLFVVHAGGAQVLKRGVIDTRGALGKAYAAELAALTAHAGVDPTLPMTRIIEQGARLHLLEAIAWAETQTTGRLVRADGTVHPAVEVLLKVMRERREVLKLLGLNRKAKPVPDLHDYLAAKAAEKQEPPTDAS